MYYGAEQDLFIILGMARDYRNAKKPHRPNVEIFAKFIVNCGRDFIFLELCLCYRDVI